MWTDDKAGGGGEAIFDISATWVVVERGFT